MIRPCDMMTVSLARLIRNRDIRDPEEIRQYLYGSMEDLPDPSKGIEALIADRDSSFRSHVSLHAMEEPFREVFELRVFGELSFREVGEIFGRTENWARVTYHRARLKLQARMEKQ